MNRMTDKKSRIAWSCATKENVYFTHRESVVGELDVQHLGLGALGDRNVHCEIAQLLDPNVLVGTAAVADGCL